MLRVSPNWFKASRLPTARPCILFRLTNAYGQYAFSNLLPDDEMLGLAEPKRADGSWLADGSATGGAMSQMADGALIKTFGALSEGLSPQTDNLLLGLSQDEMPAITILLANRANLFARLACTQNLLQAVGELLIGFEGIPVREYMLRYRGKVQRVLLTRDEATLELEAA
ncbi:MAG: hypothetical protein HY794_15760 [Desulfarculus sp.]|nr:hypothetical protein [Desulfarculus sp.]